MPSRPMLTTPARSAQRPPSAHSRIGRARRNAVDDVFDDVSAATPGEDERGEQAAQARGDAGGVRRRRDDGDGDHGPDDPAEPAGDPGPLAVHRHGAGAARVGPGDVGDDHQTAPPSATEAPLRPLPASARPTLRCSAARSARRTTSYATTTDSTMMPCMIVAISLDTLICSSDTAEVSRNAHSSAPSAIPPGWLRPSSATAMPVKPYIWVEVMP